MGKYKKFYARIRKEKETGYLIITIPKNEINLLKYKENDNLTIMAKKMEVGDFEKIKKGD